MVEEWKLPKQNRDKPDCSLHKALLPSMSRRPQIFVGCLEELGGALGSCPVSTVVPRCLLDELSGSCSFT